MKKGLFSFEDIDKDSLHPPLHSQPYNSINMRGDLLQCAMVGHRSKKNLTNAFGDIKKDTTYKFTTYDAWSMHQLLAYCLVYAGCSEVYICTWTLTEEPARAISNLKQAGAISRMHCLIDYRIANRAPGAFQMLQKIADDVKLSKAHAKVTCILGKDLHISIVGSANYSRNRRLESGVIDTRTDAVMFDVEWMKKELYGG